MQLWIEMLLLVYWPEVAVAVLLVAVYAFTVRYLSSWEGKARSESDQPDYLEISSPACKVAAVLAFALAVSGCVL